MPHLQITVLNPNPAPYSVDTDKLNPEYELDAIVKASLGGLSVKFHRKVTVLADSEDLFRFSEECLVASSEPLETLIIEIKVKDDPNVSCSRSE